MSLRLGVFALLVSLLPSVVLAQSADSLKGAELSALQAPPAALVLAGDTVMVFRAVVAGTPPSRRAANALGRVADLSTAGLYEDVRAEPVEQGYALLAGQTFLFGVANGDVDTTAHGSTETVANAVAVRLQKALRARAAAMSPAARGWAIGAVLLSTILLVFAMRSLGWIRQRALDWIHSKTERQRGKPGSLYFLSQFSVASAWLLRLATQVLGIVIFGLWVIFVMNRFPETQPWGFAARSAIFGQLRHAQDALFHALPDLIAVALIVLAARFLTQALSDLFRGVEAGNIQIPSIHPETASATRRLVTLLVWLLAIVVAYPFVPGSQSTAFKGVSVFIGILATLGSSGVVGHMVSGLVLVYSRALRRGDFVRIGDVEGTVLEVGTLSVKLSNFRDEEFTIPNTVIVATTVRNYTRLGLQGGGGLSTTVTVGYDAPWRLVYDLMTKAAGGTPGVLKDPAPTIYQTGLGSFGVDYQLVVHLEPRMTRVKVLSQLHQNIQDAFNEQGIQIMTPAFESQPEKPVLVPKERWSQGPVDGA